MTRLLYGQKKRIYDEVRKAGKVTIAELKDLTEINYNTIRGALVALTNAGMIERVAKGVYRVAKEKH